MNKFARFPKCKKKCAERKMRNEKERFGSKSTYSSDEWFLSAETATDEWQFKMLAAGALKPIIPKNLFCLEESY